MPFEIERVGHGTDNVSYLLRESSGASGAEIWPALGFNCMQWHTTAGGERTEWIYASRHFIDEPTRNGVPILFPFPNRIRNGRFEWAGKSYQLPQNCPKGKHAIHGFVCRSPWRVVDHGADGEGAWLTGEFQAATDCPGSLGCWPSDYRIRVTYRLTEKRLRIETCVDNSGTNPLPFGLGFHPYFRMPGSEESCGITLPSRELWQLEDSIPNGIILPVNERNDLRNQPPLKGLFLDDVYRLSHATSPKSNNELYLCGVILDSVSGRQLTIHVSPEFREAVAFTPPHRQAVCIEPYTCTTDAVNLQQAGVNAGLLVLEPGQQWTAVVDFWGTKWD